MGQYYVMVNLDKQEMLSPDVFGEGAKLLEFGGSSEGMLLAFAMLTATGNGDGSGDICRTAYSSQGKLYEPRTGERIHYERQQDYDHTHKQLPEGETCGFRIMVPAMAGRWAGDRIVTAGDYTPAWQFMTRTQQLEGMQLALARRAHYIRNEYKREPTDDDFESVTSNIYHYACAKFDDVSEITKEQMILFGIGRGTAEDYSEIVKGMLERSLVHDFNPMVKTGRGKNTRYKWDLSWMGAECFDSFLCRAETSADMARAKKWLKSQILQPWQLDLIKLYRFGERPTHRMLIELMREHKMHVDAERPDKQQRLIPSRQFLVAAMALEQAIDGCNMDETPVSDPTQIAIAEAAGVQVRNRVILID